MMLSAVGASAQVALQASTLNPKSDAKSSDKSEVSGGKGKDRVTISAEAVQMTRAALNATEKSHDAPHDEEKEEHEQQSAGNK